MFALALSFTSTASADIAEAEEDANNMTASLAMGVGYSWSPAVSRQLGSGSFEYIAVDIVAGVFYNLSVGVDRTVRNLDITILDEQGSEILRDVRPLRRAGVKFKASYTGRVYARVDLLRADFVGSYCLIVGKRGTANENPAPLVNALNINPDGSLK